MKTRAIEASAHRRLTRKRSPPVGRSQKDSQKELRLEVVGTEIRRGKWLVATACGPAVAQRIAEVLALMRGLSLALPEREPRVGLVARLVEKADATVDCAYDMLDRPSPLVWSRLRKLVQEYVVLRGGLETAKQRVAHRRLNENGRAASKRKHLRKRSPFGDEPNGEGELDE